MQFGEYCPVCDTFVDLGVPRNEGDVIICPDGHKLVYLESDSRYVDCRLEEYEKWAGQQQEKLRPEAPLSAACPELCRRVEGFIEGARPGYV